jgi:ATP-dependent Lhr-like helicase
VHESLRQFHPVIGRWFEERVGLPTPPQVMGWPVIHAGKSCLILAPTGSGKTLAAFLAAIDWLARKLMAAEGNVWGVQILYVSPLKSLANDVQKNLIKPLAELADVAAEMGVRDWPEIEVAVRTGDTPQKVRASIARRPPHILITTPESLNLMLTSGTRTALSSVKYCIVDEVHALAGSKRGVFLSLVLERLEEERKHEDTKGAKITKKGKGVKIAPGVYVASEPVGEMVRIGLSATARPEELIGRWLAGVDEEGKGRPMEIVKSGQRKRLDLGVVCPFGGEEEALTPEERKERGVGHWPEVTRAVLQMIREHKSTLVFGNSRRLIERLAARFQEELEKEEENTKHETQNTKQERRIPVILPHHGSIAKEVRLETEQALKRGEVDAVLATSSLELGIDIGALDLVVQIDSPGNVAAGLQRVGRAGHLEKATAKGRLLARGTPELGSLAAIVPLMYEGTVEETHVPVNCLDVLAQQIVAACVVRPWKRAALYRVLRRGMPFATLTEKQFDAVVAMLSKRAERVTSQGLRPRISFDRVNDELIIMPGASSVLMMNSGVISDTGAFPVYLIGGKKGRVENTKHETRNTKLEMAPREAAQEKGAGGGFNGLRIGELDEEFVYETKEGDRVVLGSQTWRVVRIDADRVLVERAEPGSSRMPFWRGEQAPRSEMVGEAVGRFYGEMESRLGGNTPSANMLSGAPAPLSMAHAGGDGSGEEAVRDWLVKQHHLDERAAENAVGFYSRQMERGAMPTLGRIVVEHFVDRTGEPIIAILCPLGSRLNYTLRLALEGQFAGRRLPTQIVHSDDGIIIRPPFEVGEIPENPLAWLRASTLEGEIVDQLESTSLFGLRFRQNAARALMLPRMNVTQRTPLWQQRLRARHLLALVKKERNFPIIVETYRECLQDVLAIGRVEKLLGQMERGEVAVEVARNTEPSPFARSLFSQFQQSYLYQWDDPLLHADFEPTVDQGILDEILQRRLDDKVTRGQGDKVDAGWEAVDEVALARRIVGADYPARTSEELLEKIEAAGGVGVAFGFADDPRWSEWAVGGMEDARRMLVELSEKRRIFLVEWTGKKRGGEWRGVAAENLALVTAARGERPMLRRFTGDGVKAASYEDVPEALLESDLSKSESRRLLVEQAVKREAVATVQGLERELPWIEVERVVREIVRQGFALELADGRVVWTEYAEQLRSLALRRQRRAASTADVAALQRHLLHWQHVDQPREGVDALEDALDMFVGVALPLELWEQEVLPLRVKEFLPAMLDGICISGHRVWVGSGGGEEGRVAFWPRHLLTMRGAADASKPLSVDAEKVLEFLRKNGASFLVDLQIALTLDDTETALALRELVFAGKVSNDQLEGLREVQRLSQNAMRDRRERVDPLRSRYPESVRGAARQRKLAGGWWKQRTATGGAASLGGRWFILPEPQAAVTAMDITERAADRVERLLRRTGFACRELLEPEVDGPWRDCYDVLTRMEWAGTVRRGYFVEGISGSQFAAPAVRLGGDATGDVVWLSMQDPANVWSQVNTRWVSDAGEPARIARAAGNWIALVEGRPVLAAVNWGHRLIPLPAEDGQHERALATLHTLLDRLPRSHRNYLDVRQWDQQDIVGSVAENILRQQGFTRDTQGLRLYRRYFPQAGAAPRVASGQTHPSTPEGDLS